MDLHRHYSDSTLAFAPRNPSRLGPVRGGQMRGTVSLPTSPILSTRHVPEPPMTAQAYFNIDDTYPWGDTTHSTFHSSGSIPLPLEDEYGEVQAPSNIEPMRKKRAQVRVACTHCQEACKKCSNTRPCDRCVKYGLKECVDSTRKPRRTGVKRGPYKRRSSGKYHDIHDGHHQPYFDPQNPFQQPPFGISTDYPTPPHQTHQTHQSHQTHIPPSHAAHPLHPPFPSQQPQPNSAVHNGYTSPPEDPFPYPPASTQHPPANSHFQTDPQSHSHSHSRSHSSSLSLPPGPRTAALHGAFAQALDSSPRWINGQRVVHHTPHHQLNLTNLGHKRGGGQAGQAGQAGQEVLYPPTPSLPFPISLNHHHSDDPFSRAVSPIHSDLDTALQSLKPRPPPPPSQSIIEFTDPFAPFPLPPSSASSYSTAQDPHDWGGVPDQSQTHGPKDSLQSPAIIALKKIRKPSLRTLMSHGGSLASSRQTSPVMDSPTLYNLPMEVDDGLDVTLVGPWQQQQERQEQREQEREGGEDGLNLIGPFGNPF